MSHLLHNNPFQITSPEDLTADETISLFVDVFTDFKKIIDSGHVFLIGPRGTGKSMMFRYLMPDCQRLKNKCTLSEIPFLGVYVPLKNTNFALSELKRFEHRHASDILNEHILTTHFSIKIFNTLANPELYQGNENIDAIKKYYYDIFRYNLLKVKPNCTNYELDEKCSITDIFLKIAAISESFYNEALTYAKGLAFRTDILPYDGPLCDYIGFLLPVLTGLTKLPVFPKGSIYLLIDDAHWLTETQARVLNTWVSTRTSRIVSLKVSTQYNYKTYYTLTGATIDTPHDYSEIDITTIYTGSSKSKYRERISDIVKKRLILFGINDVSPEDYFPEDVQQESEIQRIRETYLEKYDKGEAKGHYRSDDALRYARPDFIKSAIEQENGIISDEDQSDARPEFIKDSAGKKKASSKYSYAGFKQLVHLSSGIVRHFIQPAHLMYAETKSQKLKEETKYIPQTIQNEIVREEANNFLFTDLERIEKEGHVQAPPKEDIKKLSNLIQGLGGLFRQILLSERRSERRIFSIAFSDSPSEEAIRILDLGIQLGYFHKSTIGRKDSKSGGRTRLYILNRRLAPIWTLDPTGFAGYLFVTNSLIEEAMQRPFSMLRRISSEGIPQDNDIVQLELSLEDEK